MSVCRIINKIEALNYLLKTPDQVYFPFEEDCYFRFKKRGILPLISANVNVFIFFLERENPTKYFFQNVTTVSESWRVHRSSWPFKTLDTLLHQKATRKSRLNVKDLPIWYHFFVRTIINKEMLQSKRSHTTGTSHRNR